MSSACNGPDYSISYADPMSSTNSAHNGQGYQRKSAYGVNQQQYISTVAVQNDRKRMDLWIEVYGSMTHGLTKN